jgi:hypothetical protein
MRRVQESVENNASLLLCYYSFHHHSEETSITHAGAGAVR